MTMRMRLERRKLVLQDHRDQRDRPVLPDHLDLLDSLGLQEKGEKMGNQEIKGHLDSGASTEKRATKANAGSTAFVDHQVSPFT